MKYSKKLTKTTKPTSPPLTFLQIQPYIQSLQDTSSIIKHLIKQSTNLLVENQINRAIPNHTANCSFFWLMEVLQPFYVQYNTHSLPCEEDMEPFKPNLDTFQNFKIDVKHRSRSVENIVPNESQISSIVSVRIKKSESIDKEKSSQSYNFQPIALNSIVEKGDQEKEDETYRKMHDLKITKIIQEQNMLIQIRQEYEKKEKDLNLLKKRLSQKGFTYDYNGNYIMVAKPKQLNATTITQPLNINIPEESSIKEQQVVPEIKQVIEKPQQKSNLRKNRTLSEHNSQQLKGSLEIKMPEKQQSKYENQFDNLTEQQKITAMQEPTLKLTKNQYYEMQDLYEKINREKILARQQLRQKQLQAQLLVKDNSELSNADISNIEPNPALKKYKKINSQGMIKYIKDQTPNRYLIDHKIARNDDSTQLPQLPQQTNRSQNRLSRTRSAIRSRVFSQTKK